MQCESLKHYSFLCHKQEELPLADDIQSTMHIYICMELWEAHEEAF